MATGRIELDVKDRKLLEGWSRAQRVEHRLKIRSQIILKAAEGCNGREIGKSLGDRDRAEAKDERVEFHVDLLTVAPRKSKCLTKPFRAS